MLMGVPRTTVGQPQSQGHGQFGLEVIGGKQHTKFLNAQFIVPYKDDRCQ